MLKNTSITLLIISSIMLITVKQIYPKPENISKRELKKIYTKYSITSDKDGSYDTNLARINLIIEIEPPLIPVFAHSFKHSLISAFQSNGVEASIIMENSPKSDSMANATILINIKTIYRKHPDGYQAIVGNGFDVSLVNMATEKRIWYATGKVDYIRDYYFNRVNYSAHSALRREFAFKYHKSNR